MKILINLKNNDNIILGGSMKKKSLIICLSIIIILSSIFVLRTSYFQGHDLDFHLSRIISIKDCIGMKRICYVAPKYLNGYGYGTPLFYPELFLIFPAILLYLGFPLSISYRIFIFSINALSILSMFYSVKRIIKDDKKAILSSFLYAFTSYRVIDLTTRGALGEALSFMFFPLVILGIYEIVYGDYKNYKYLILGMSGVLLCHILSSIIVFIYLVIFCLINIKRLFKDKNRIKYLLISTLITFLLTSYFTLPMLEQLFSSHYRASIETSTLSYRAMPFYHIFLESSFAQLIDGSKWIWSPGTVGTVYIIIIVLYIVSLTMKNKYTSFLNQSMIISIFFILLTTKLFPWDAFQHVLYFLQFPWRFNMIPAMILPFISSTIIDKFKNSNNLIIFMVIVIGIISIESVTVFKNTKYVDKNNYNDYDIMFGEYLPVSTNEYYINNRKLIVSNNKDLEFNYEREDNTLYINFKNNTEDTSLELPYIYYKGYSAYINSKKLDTYEGKHGLVSIDVDKKYKEGKIKIFYEGTPLQKVTRYISILTLAIGIFFYAKKSKIKQQNV